MLFAIDIDGTIAGTDHGREYAHYLNRVLGIGLSEEKVAAYEPIVLIDDHAGDIVKTFRRLVKEYYQVAKSVYGRFGLVAFGTDKPPTVPNQLRIPVLALPSWEKEEIQQLIR